ncbi:MAG: polyphosphate kinase [Verrucomicrobiota bacterium]|jgi:polyphosphate kinase|nr:polyphosphate kinase [Verrucomicrobiota bacterium]MDK2962937.1 polyphosphate kinase [Verrucomicrobiota bacterium]
MMMSSKPKKFFNRELSWIDFNQRVLEEAKDPRNPLLERLKFLSITASNLDEFFMVRVGGLQLVRKAGKRKADASGLTPRMQLEAIQKRTRQMIDEQYDCYTNSLEPALAAGGIVRIKPEELNGEQEQYLMRLFSDEIYPVITPVALQEKLPTPALQNLTLYLLVRFPPESGETEDRYAVLSLGKPLERFISLPAENSHVFILIEDVIKKHIGRWFSGLTALECALFRVTRNADIEVREDEASDLLSGMASILEERRWSNCVRLEIEASASRSMQNFLGSLLDTPPSDVFRINGPLNLKDFMPLAQIEGFSELKSEDWYPQPSPQIDRHQPMVEQIAAADILLYHPYESFDPVVRLIEEAARDPSVLAIKQVLYRTSSASPIIAALADAAETGKSVTALVELKARFDEERNINWAQRLEQAGVQVVYGVQGLKTHAKVCLIVRRELQGIVRYVHYGTGNYNDSTAKLYSDISFMTCDDALGSDASAFFNAVCGYSQPSGLRKICMAPLSIRNRLIELIDGEIERSRQGQKAQILLKMNSLVDEILIEKLYEASQAGVRIKLNVRGICCLQPGIPDLSKNITVISIVGRYLEHARIFYFYRNGEEKVFISSADWMPRNLDRRVELMIPIEDPPSRQRLIQIIKTHCDDTVKSWTLLSDGTYVRTAALPGRKKKKINSQQFFYEQACEAVRNAARLTRTTLRPHRPADKK